MSIHWILGDDLIERGFTLEEEFGFLCLWYKDEQVATFGGMDIRLTQIKHAAQAWLKEHQTNSSCT